jgi:outer membrane biosynthesis protein TonB
VPRKLDPRRLARVFALLGCAFSLAPAHAAPRPPADDAALSAAVCSMVYPVDQTPSDRGYRYVFYGNGFFINEQGYLVTAVHVLSQFRSGQPYILLHPPEGPPRFVRANVVAVDPDHDIAILRATPNPFENGFKVGFLPLASAWLAPGRTIFAASRHPTDPLHAYTSDAFVDDRSSGQVFDFQFSQLYKRRGETELVLFTPQVRRGQSGAPVISPESQEVVGMVEGQWLRSTVVQLATASDGDTPGVGAAVPVHYVIALLLQKGIPWHSAPAASKPSGGEPATNAAFSPPSPLSLVASSFPSQSLFGDEVVLDALVDSSGRVSDTRMVRGESPFLENALAAVRTWSFLPARLEGQPVASRVGIIFQFVQSYDPLRAKSPKPSVQPHDEPLSSSSDRAALPVVTSEPKFPATATRDGVAILSGLVGSQGQLASLETLQDSESLAPASKSAIEKWRFVPGRRAGSDSESRAIVVVVFRYSGNPRPSSATVP